MGLGMKKILACIRKADQEYNLIADNDVIAVGLSGGKDSSLLLYALYLYRFLANSTFKKDFQLIGIHIDLNFDADNFAAVAEFFKPYAIPLYREKSQIADILKLNLHHGMINCSLCSTLKKGAVIKEAKKHGCNKVAFGHHGDDAIETLFLNLIYGGKLATFDPIMHLATQDIIFIRPLIYAFEKDIKKALNELNIPAVKSGCPNDGFTKRAEIKALLNDLYHHYPQAQENFLLALHNQEQLNLFHCLADKDTSETLKE